jgi:hypothetical protein
VLGPKGSYYQLPLVAGTRAGSSDKSEQRRILEGLDARRIAEIDALAPVSFNRTGGRFSRPIPYLCSDAETYWTKTKSQTGLCSELIVNRLAHRPDVGPATTIVRIDGFLRTVGNSARAVGTLNVSNVVASKELMQTGLESFTATVVDANSWTRASVFQSWIDVVDEQLLVRTTDGVVFTYDHRDRFANLMPGPPRMVVAALPSLRLDWSATSTAAMDMVLRIEQLSAVEILEAVAGIPDEPGLQGLLSRRFGIARWLIKRQGLLRGVDQSASVTVRGFYSLIRYQPDPVREEFKNVGVLLLGEDGSYRGLRTLRPGTISRTAEEQGLLAAVIGAVEHCLGQTADGLGDLRQLAETYSHSILVSDPRPAMSPLGWAALLETLYGALVAPKTRPPVGYTKGHVLDRLHKWFVGKGSSFEIGGQLEGYSFDAILRTSTDVTYAMQVNSFAARQVDSRRLELEVRHFLYVAPRIQANCIGLIQPATVNATAEIHNLQDRVASWFNDAGVPVLSPTAFRETMTHITSREPTIHQQLVLVT